MTGHSEPAAYRVDALCDVRPNRLAVSCVQCGALFSVENKRDDRSVFEQAFYPGEAVLILREHRFSGCAVNGDEKGERRV